MAIFNNRPPAESLKFTKRTRPALGETDYYRTPAAVIFLLPEHEVTLN